MRTATNEPMSTATVNQVRKIGEAFVCAMQPLVDAETEQSRYDADYVESVHEALSSALVELADLGIWGPANRLASDAFWKAAAPILSRGRLQNHAREKPHGYAGDFEMLGMICREARFGSGLAWAFDDYFQRQAAPCAVRNRMQIVADELRQYANRQVDLDRPLSVVSFGSGPAADVEAFVRAAPESSQQINFTLLDLDPHALEGARSRLEPIVPKEKLTCRRVNLKRLPQLSKEMARLANTDFLFCTGFFDYLDQDESSAMLRALWSLLSDRGEMLVFNFSDVNPSRAYMEWVGNWYLNHRTQEELCDIAHGAGIPTPQFRVDVEPAKVNLFLHACRS